MSKILCSNDGYTAVDFQALPANKVTVTATDYDLGIEVNSTDPDTWVEECEGTGNTREPELTGFAFIEPRIHPGQFAT
ncbi:MAG: hypothetical protein AB8B97_13990 [Granulosicoccus sp.]